jgi:hypothetical protein
MPKPIGIRPRHALDRGVCKKKAIYPSPGSFAEQREAGVAGVGNERPGALTNDAFDRAAPRTTSPHQYEAEGINGFRDEPAQRAVDPRACSTIHLGC